MANKFLFNPLGAPFDLVRNDLADLATRDHGSLTDLTASDDHTQYALLAGRSGGQTLYGGTSASNPLTLVSTSHATKDGIFFGLSGVHKFDEVNGFWGIGTAASTEPMQVVAAPTDTGAGTSRAYLGQLTPNPASASSHSFYANDNFLTVSAGTTSAYTGSLVGGRYLVQLLGDQAVTTGTGLLLQAFLGPIFGAPNSTGTVTTITGAQIQVNNKSNASGTVTTTGVGGYFFYGHFSPGNITTAIGAHLAIGGSSAGAGVGTITNLYAAKISRRNPAGTNSLSAGTITNAYMCYIDGWPTTGMTYTNAPVQLQLESSDVTTTIGIRQLGTNSHNRFQGLCRFGDDVTPTFDIGLGGNAARTIGIERHTTANTAGNNFTVRGGGATVGATNKVGGTITVQSGTGTGNAVPSRVDIQGPASGAASGTTDQAMVTRVGINGTATIPTGSATTLLTIPLATLQMCNGLLAFGIEVSDGTDMIAYCGSVYFSAVNKAGTYTSGLQPLLSSSALSAADTIAPVFTITTGTNQILLKVDPVVTGMTPTINRITYTLLSYTQQDISF